MTSRRQSATTLSTRRGKPRPATAIRLLRGRGPVWQYGSYAGYGAPTRPADGVVIRTGRDWDRAVARLTIQPFRAANSRRRRNVADTTHMIIETTCCTRERARMH